MKALSVRQPWAWLIIHAGKDIENRTWRTEYRGPLLIHASQKLDQSALEFLQVKFPHIKLPHGFRTGMVIGAVDLVECISNPISKWHEPGMWGWVLHNPRPLPFFTVRGKLGLFDVEYPGKAVTP